MDSMIRPNCTIWPNFRFIDRTLDKSTRARGLNVDRAGLNAKPIRLNVDSTEHNVKRFRLNVKPIRMNVDPTGLNVKRIGMNVDPGAINVRAVVI